MHALVQVTLYQLLMEERYGQHIERGLLWYLREASPEVIARSPYEVQLCLTASSFLNLQACRYSAVRQDPPPLVAQ